MRVSTWLLACMLLPNVALATASPLPIIDDDYARARAEATQRKLPMFVDVWAPW